MSRHWTMVLVFLMLYFGLAFWTTPMANNIPWCLGLIISYVKTKYLRAWFCECVHLKDFANTCSHVPWLHFPLFVTLAPSTCCELLWGWRFSRSSWFFGISGKPWVLVSSLDQCMPKWIRPSRTLIFLNSYLYIFIFTFFSTVIFSFVTKITVWLEHRDKKWTW